jgi:hypothetical protein
MLKMVWLLDLASTCETKCSVICPRHFLYIIRDVSNSDLEGCMWLNLDMISFQYLIHSEIDWVALRIVVTPYEDKPTNPLTVDLPEMKRLTDWKVQSC